MFFKVNLLEDHSDDQRDQEEKAPLIFTIPLCTRFLLLIVMLFLLKLLFFSSSW